MSETRTPYRTRLTPEEAIQQTEDREETKRRELLLTIRAGHLQIANGIAKYLELEEKKR